MKVAFALLAASLFLLGCTEPVLPASTIQPEISVSPTATIAVSPPATSPSPSDDLPPLPPSDNTATEIPSATAQPSSAPDGLPPLPADVVPSSGQKTGFDLEIQQVTIVPTYPAKGGKVSFTIIALNGGTGKGNLTGYKLSISDPYGDIAGGVEADYRPDYKGLLPGETYSIPSGIDNIKYAGTYKLNITLLGDKDVNLKNNQGIFEFAVSGDNTCHVMAGQDAYRFAMGCDVLVKSKYFVRLTGFNSAEPWVTTIEVLDGQKKLLKRTWLKLNEAGRIAEADDLYLQLVGLGQLKYGAPETIDLVVR